METIRKLTADEIEVKVKQVTEKGCLLLLYKTARTDRQILDEVFGPMNWTSDYKEIKGNLYCGIGCREDEERPFVWKWDCGIESREDEEGNQKKGEASDSFKRAGFQWGIGVELYTSPFIWAKVETVKQTSKTGREFWVLKNPYTRFNVGSIGYDEETGKINRLLIVDDKGNEIFSYPNKKPVFEKEAAAEKTARTKALKAGQNIQAPKQSLDERYQNALKYLQENKKEYTNSVIDRINGVINDLFAADEIEKASNLKGMMDEHMGLKDDALEAFLDGNAQIQQYAI